MASSALNATEGEQDASSSATKVPPRTTVRLSDRMAELALCSADRADKILQETADYRTRDDATQFVYVRGDPINAGTDVQVPADEEQIVIDGPAIRLSKRLSELGICSRREAAAILKEMSECAGIGAGGADSLRHLKEVIYLRGKPAMGGAATKVPPNEKFVEIRAGDDPPPEEGSDGMKTAVPYADRPWEEIMGDTIVLNKPIGYVSGQEEHQHVPAVRLLNRDNMHLDGFFDAETQRSFRERGALSFDKWKFEGFDLKANSVPRKIRDALREEELKEEGGVTETLVGYAPAGRLDIDSTGLLLFTRAGIMARQLIQPKTSVAKEYIVKVQPAVQPSKREIELGIKSLPVTTHNLGILLKKGNRIAGVRHALKPLLVAEWLEDETTDEEWERKVLTMRLVMVEGKKRQIRRMCREILGWHVVGIHRTSVGPVNVDSLPEGKWRPLTHEEVKLLCSDAGKEDRERRKASEKARDAFRAHQSAVRKAKAKKRARGY